MSSYKILIVDDNLSFVSLLKTILKEIGFEQIRDAQTVVAGLKLFHDFQPDICLLDIQLSPGEKDGIVLANLIREAAPNTPLIFLTSYFQQDIYDAIIPLKPTGFMNKELSRLKIQQAIELARNQIESNKLESDTRSATEVASLPDKESSVLNGGQIFFKVGDAYKPIHITDIDFFYADNKLTYARSDGRNYPTYVQLKVLTDELAPTFLRCHKKYLVNVNRIDSILLKEGKVKIAGELFTIGYAYRKAFLKGINLLK
ncbi:MAG: LytR/AlgR family response regulator transcription factor [Lewinella sp.]